MAKIAIFTVCVVERMDTEYNWSENPEEFEYFLEQAQEASGEDRAFTVSVLASSGYFPIADSEEHRTSSETWVQEAKRIACSLAFWKEWKGSFQVIKREREFINDIK